MSVAALCVKRESSSTEIALGTDSLVSYGGNVYAGPCKYEEIVPGFWFVAVGQLRANQILSHALRGRLGDTPLPGSLYDVIELMGSLYKTAIDFGAEERGQDGDLPLQPSQFFLVCAGKAYLVCDDYSVREITDYAAIGAGADLALGVMCDRYQDGYVEPAKIVSRSLEAACAHSPFCGGEVHVEQLKFPIGEQSHKLEAATV